MGPARGRLCVDHGGETVALAGIGTAELCEYQALMRAADEAMYRDGRSDVC